MARVKKIQKFNLELTDTFGGEANYSWVRRKELVTHCTSTRSLVLLAKKAFGLPARHKTTDWGDMIQVDFMRDCVRMFIAPHLGPDDALPTGNSVK